jgi:hypothetical protein
VTLTSEEYVQDDDILLPCAVLETDDHCTEVKNTDTAEEKEGMKAVCKPVPECSEAMQCLDINCHFLSGIPDVPESIIRNLREMKIFLRICLKDKTKNVRYALQEKITFTNKLFDFNHYSRNLYVYLKACVFTMLLAIYSV